MINGSRKIEILQGAIKSANAFILIDPDELF